ncbi:putative acyl-activating enzyme 10 [Hibiscus syriacus]|uniref:Acyl-activating enzyme 10 n=1 Tax=Hibiscus syriacus TaxID=106335 RepID=A0A6A2XD36_HIBSY|nr:probable acyl-activating enzyme 6 [Hibiscus syriacus]KAE8656339.1 putative acyl-activating enzyme 10 [Hibiscus syriacus]
MEQPRESNSTPLTTLGFLERAALAYGDCPSIVYNDSTYTWSQTNRRSLQLASSLSSVGIARGRVVSVVAPNIPATYELHFAVPMCGAILNTINIRLDARTVSTILRHSESKLVFVDHYYVPLVLEAIALLSSNGTEIPLLVLINDDEPSPSSTVDDNSNFIDTYENMVNKGDPGFKWIRPESEWDPMVLNYTSGTTSSPKGVVHCHRGIFITTVSSLVDWSVPHHPVFLWTLPMFHANGWCYTWGMAAVGGTNVCLRKFDGTIIYNLIKRHHVTHICGAPVVLNMVVSSTSLTNQPLEKPVQFLASGAPVPAPLLLRAESLGFRVTHCYGLTETAGYIVSCASKPQWDSLHAPDRARLKARQGVRTIGVMDMDVVDPERETNAEKDGSSLGEIVVKGGQLMLGYLKDPTATASCMRRDGWFYTGDAGVVHPDGYLEIKDRSKDVIISGGENISSAEVESVLYSNPAVKEAAVVARPDEFWGETPCAFVCLKDEYGEKPTEKEMIEYCRAKLPHYMAPKTVLFKEELPRTSTGKIKKFVLREIAKALS